MLTKKTSKNQVTLPLKILEKIPKSDYFEVKVRGNEIILSPVEIVSAGGGGRLREVRAKIKNLGLKEEDIADAIRWARRKTD